MPHKQYRLIQAWALLHNEDLAVNWEIARDGEVPFKIEPLR